MNVASGLTTKTVCPLTRASIIACAVPLPASRIEREIICVVPEPATPCGPTKVKSAPFHAYSCLLTVSNQKSPTVNPTGAVEPTSAPPVVRNLVPS